MGRRGPLVVCEVEVEKGAVPAEGDVDGGVVLGDVVCEEAHGEEGGVGGEHEHGGEFRDGGVRRDLYMVAPSSIDRAVKV